ncbi:MAG: hypothetical protein RLZZ479_1504 [Bacteroidota bacterium]
MKYYIIIPAYNEEAFMALTLQSLVAQTVLPSKIIVVNDNSSDKTAEIVTSFSEKFPFITLVNKKSDAIHLPGSKVIQAFQEGEKHIDDEYEIIVKVDADLIFPNNYFESIIKHFQSDATIGMVGGFCYIEKNGDWVLENLTDKDHIRGALKAYRKEAYQQIGGSKFDFPHVEPGIYELRAIEDKNNNGLWDLGNFRTKTKPEAIHYFPTKIKLKANFQITDVLISTK